MHFAKYRLYGFLRQLGCKPKVIASVCASANVVDDVERVFVAWCMRGHTLGDFVAIIVNLRDVQFVSLGHETLWRIYCHLYADDRPAALPATVQPMVIDAK